MNSFEDRLNLVCDNIRKDDYCVMIIGLGSVGSYLLDYLVGTRDSSLRIVVVGRSYEKMEMVVNITRISGLIRERNRARIEIADGVDLNDVSAIRQVLEKYRPDFVVNSSRAYPGLKYGTISWTNLRAYGIWSPLAIRYTKNIMQAAQEAKAEGIFINTSYSDAVIPWLKSAGKAYPDFGSGNLNHLIPRMKYAVAQKMHISDYWNISIMFAAGHFHDVCISKEGHTEGVELPLAIFYNNEKVDIDSKEVFSACKIPMPTDATRNKMNASSNYRIINSVVECARNGESQLVFSPGVFGELGGYPVRIIQEKGRMSADIDTGIFSMEQMRNVNEQSMALDGVEKIENGTLYYTDALCRKVKDSFGVTLPKTVPFEQIEQTADYLIKEIILPQTKIER
jgi:hypothetical protein